MTLTEALAEEAHSIFLFAHHPKYQNFSSERHFHTGHHVVFYSDSVSKKQSQISCSASKESNFCDVHRSLRLVEELVAQEGVVLATSISIPVEVVAVLAVLVAVALFLWPSFLSITSIL